MASRSVALLLGFALLLPSTALATRPISARVGLFNEATALPYQSLVTTPLHPGFEVGLELTWHETRLVRWSPAVSVGYMFHRHLFQGLYLGVEQGFELKSPWGFALKSALGLAYLHTFSTQQEYQFKEGSFQSKVDGGNPRLMPSFSLGLGYRLKQEEVASPEIYISYQSWIEYPYSPGFIPLMTHTSLHLGATFPIFR